MNRKVIVIMAAVAIVCMMLVGGGFYMMWTKIASLQPPEDIVEEEVEEVEEVPAVGEMFALETFVVNLADIDGNHYLRATMQLELAPDQSAEELEKRLPQIRDMVLTILPTKSSADLRTVEGKTALRTEIMDGLNDLLMVEGIVNIYFTEFVIQ